MARLLVAILACSLGYCSSSSCSSSGCALDQSFEVKDESLHLLQRKAKSATQGDMGAKLATQGRTASVAIIKAYNDSQCTNLTGAMMNVSLSADACFLGWTFSCTCVGNSKALVGKKYDRFDCQSGPSKEHIIPVGTCADGNVTIESSNVYEFADDLGNCPSCSGVSLQETAKETKPIMPGGGITIGGPLIDPDFSIGDFSFDNPIIGEFMYHGPGCMDGPPFDTFFLPSIIGNPNILAASSSPPIFNPTDTLGPIFNGVYLGMEFQCSCKGPDKRLNVFDFDALQYARLIDDHIEPIFSFPDGECFDFPGFDGGEIDLSIFTDASECPPCPATCIVCGDPHVTVFDKAEVALLGTGIGMKRESSRRTADVNDEFGWGDFWLVKSSEVSMQGRYRKVYYPKANQPLNNTYLTAMAVGGPFMRGHRLIVEPRIGSVAWVHPDGSSMELFPSDETSDNDEDKEQFFEHGDLIKANYSKRTAIVANHGIVQGLDVELPSGVTLVIDRFGKHLDLRIEMTASAGGEGGVDGQCGNFNGDATDDTTELLEQRIGYQVPTDELLFI